MTAVRSGAAAARSGAGAGQTQTLTARPTPPVKVWAVVGALTLAFIVWVLARWITGPLFQSVPSGPSDPPGWMKVTLLSLEVISPAAALALIFHFVARPLWRERTLSLDGVLIVSFCTLWFQDPLCNLAGSWVTYNTWLVNMGSWHASVPGSVSYAGPGQMLAEPLLLIPFLYVYFFWLACLIGSWVMRKVAARKPGASKLTLVGACFAAMLFFDFVLEGLIWMPAGAWTLAGGTAPVLFPGTYHQFVVNEWVPVSATLAAVACIRYFRDDRGRTIAERGVDSVKTSEGRKLGLRVLATIGVVHAAMLACYTIPNLVFGMNVQEWPDDVQKRSYFTDYICGDGTDRACPGPELPLIRNDNQNPGRTSIYVNPQGELVVPPNAQQPRLVPFDKGPLGGGE